MYSLLLRKALPFALTFILGSLVGGLFKAVGIGGLRAERTRAFHYGYGGRHACRARQRFLVAESKPLAITFKPDARSPHTFDDYGHGSPGRALVRVTFGADGTVQGVEPFYEYARGMDRLPLGPKWREHWENVESAARLIQFTPEVRDGVPVTVTKELEMHFLPE